MQFSSESGYEHPYLDMDLLRFTTAGSVDDGKSTLIGRLLYDTKATFEDQMEAIRQSTRLRGEDGVNLALLTDGLRAEREQGITIDVAYRYFATPRRKFIIADTPGHLQYTRNMVTGASTADLAIVLIDARRGVMTQSRRHGFLASLLQIGHVVVAVNKMDLVDYSEAVFRDIVATYEAFAREIGVPEITFIPVSALEGDNVAERSENMPWYDGPTLLEHLETVPVRSGRDRTGFRMPVQYVIRPHQDFRGFAGRVASGSIRPGDDVVVLPSGVRSRVRSIVTFEGERPQATAAESVVLTLEDEIDISRGDLIVAAEEVPQVGQHLDAMLCWMNGRPLRTDKPYLLQHTGRTVQAVVSRITYRLDIDTLERESAALFDLNDIGRVELTTSGPVPFDAYAQNRTTGSFILIDPDTNDTVAAGMIEGAVQAPGAAQRAARRQKSPGVVWEGLNIPRGEREARNGHASAVLWFTGLSGAGKSTIARQLEKRLFELGCQTMLLDGDQVRHGLCGDLGFSAEDRRENIRRVGEVARLFFEQGSLTLCTFISPFREERAVVRSLVPAGRFLEVYVACALDVCEQRDPKGLYEKARTGQIPEFTGVSSPYEAPEAPDLVLHTDRATVTEAVEELLNLLETKGILNPGS